ncbi:glycosyltransferase family 2 protein [Pseudorhizobium pelagicum]|uniref:Glycosyl transferase family A n=1 Tax=Pseudorhizobium pelagicum TaxID=1509405 RepID=A0A922P171_9HYPH|nr:glycosyltransferase family 2 protein [Pseudorhizobium pelagicum]KEQ04469.1 glycosyl transferase family A [Pseudorhizobium pelagicum]KEQ06629.1 glycosyl transferase family A [Pseudorhizobium pelagicum]
MSEETGDAVCVIIAARNAAGTIAMAVASALEQPQVSEVVVVDDASSDATAAAARAADDGSGRLRVVSFDTNRGPAAVRNHAISISSAPLVAILDADDFFFPGRFAAMLEQRDWDFIADNIAFMHQPAAHRRPQLFQPRARQLSTLEFIEGNISRPGIRRGEIGFLKPVMRRAFLARHDLRYNEALRLGEDYELYLRALIKGARYTVIEHCGYGAVVRADSLSGQHRTEDLKRLCAADGAIRTASRLAAPLDRALGRHQRHIRDRYELRAFLDTKARNGSLFALRHLIARPTALPAVATGILRDKLRRADKRDGDGDAVAQADYRYLLAGTPVAQK